MMTDNYNAIHNLINKNMSYPLEEYQNVNSQHDSSFKQENYSQNMAKSRTSKRSIELKLQIIKNLSQKIINLQKQSKKQRINVYQLQPYKMDINQEFQNYQKTKLMFLQQKNKTYFNHYQYLSMSTMQNEKKNKNNLVYKTASTSFFPTSTQAQSQVSRKSFNNVQIQTVPTQLKPLDLISTIQNKSISAQNIRQIQSLNRQDRKNQDKKANRIIPQNLEQFQPKINQYQYFINQLFLPENHLPLNSQFSFSSEDMDDKLSDNGRKPQQTERYFKQSSLQIQRLRESRICNLNQSLKQGQIARGPQMSQEFNLNEKVYNSQKYVLCDKSSVKFNKEEQQQQIKYFKLLAFCSKVVSYDYQINQKSNLKNIQDQIQTIEQQNFDLKNKLTQNEAIIQKIQSQLTLLTQQNIQVKSALQQKMQELTFTLQSMEVMHIGFVSKQKQYLTQIESIEKDNQCLNNTIAAFRIKIKQEGVSLNYAEVELLEQIMNKRQESFVQDVKKYRQQTESYQKTAEQYKKQIQDYQAQVYLYRKQTQQNMIVLNQKIQKKSQQLCSMEQNALQVMNMYDKQIQSRDQQILKMSNQFVLLKRQSQKEKKINTIIQESQLQHFGLKYNIIDYLVLKHKYLRVCNMLEKQVNQNELFNMDFAMQLKNIHAKIQDQKQYEQYSYKDTQIIKQLTFELEKQIKKNQKMQKLLSQKQSISAASQNVKNSQLKLKLQKMRKYANILQKQIRAIYKVNQCEQHCQFIQKLTKLVSQNLNLSKS